MKRNKLLALPLAIALGLEIIAPGGEEQHPHTEKEIILAPEPTGAEADALAPLATPPENPWLSDFALRVLKPEELEGWWVNTATTRSGGLVTVLRTQTCGEARFKEIAVIKNLNMPEGQQEVKTAVYLNEDYCISWRNRKMCEQLQEWCCSAASPLKFYFTSVTRRSVHQTTGRSHPTTHRSTTMETDRGRWPTFDNL